MLKELTDPYRVLIQTHTQRLEKRYLDERAQWGDPHPNFHPNELDPEEFASLGDSVREVISSSPWIIRVYAQPPLQIGSRVVAVLIPDHVNRAKYQPVDWPEYDTSREFPLLLLNERLNSSQAVELTETVNMFSDILGINFMSERRKTEMVIGYLLGLILEGSVAMAWLGGYPTFYDLRRLIRPGVEPSAHYDRIAALSSEQQLQLEIWTGKPFVAVSDLLDLCDSHLKALLRRSYASSRNARQFLWTLTLPFGTVSLDVWQQAIVRKPEIYSSWGEPTLPIAYHDAVFIDENRLHFDALKQHLPELAAKNIEAISCGHASGESQPKAELKRHGARWLAVFEGKSRWLDHRIGILYICELLANPGQKFPPEALEFAVFGKLDAGKRSGHAAQAVREGSMRIAKSVSQFDPDGYRILKDKLETICLALQSGTHSFDEDQIARLMDEKNKLRREISRIYKNIPDKKHPERTPILRDEGHTQSQLSDSVRKDIDNALKHIGEMFPELHEHLAPMIKKHGGIRYEASQYIWDIHSPTLVNSKKTTK